ncbi:cell division protein FtsK, partial [candidate division KSB3 bacterium]|nr:cell division protein FtsK [candidate division KSB3 bacterium]
NGRSTLFQASGTAKDTAVRAIQSLLLRLLAVVPPGKLRFTFIDPVALGHNAAPFMHLADHDDALVTARAWSEKNHIERQLVDLTDHISDVIQKYLRNQYATIEEYNEQAGEVAEPYRLLVVFDFPVNFSDDAARRLVSIVQNGPRCGVYTLILHDPQQKLPYGFNLRDLEEFTSIITWNDSQFIWQEPDFQECQLDLDQPPQDDLFNRIVNAVGEAAIEAGKVEVPFETVLEKAQLTQETWWQGSTVDGIQIPLGPIGAKKVQYLDFGQGTAQHALIAGKTGSGKSTLLHVLISTLTLKYSPTEIELYLIDFKKGVEFKTYATHHLPHARVIAIESEREFGLSVLEGLDAELKRRGDLFRNTEVGGIKEYRQKTTQNMPRILLLVDEFQEFFTIDDAIASKASQILDRLVRQGRAFGIHVLLGSQTLAGAYTLARSTIDQMAIRIALQCSEADSRLILSDDNPAARLLSRPGEAIYNSANGLIEGNNPFQVAWLPDDKQETYLDHVRTLARNDGYWPLQSQIVFEGNAPARPDTNRGLQELLEHPRWSENLRRYSAWLGEPIAIKEATQANFRRQSGSNLLVIGQQDEAVIGMLTINLLTLSAQYRPNAALFYILDFGNVDAPHAHFLNSLTDMLPQQVKYGRRRHLPDIINTVYQEVEDRLAHEDERLEKKPSIYLIIYGLQRARDLEKDDGFSSFDYSTAPPFGMSDDPAPPPPALKPGQQFPKILREGPDLGIHTIVWCDTYTNLNRRLDH